MRAVYQPDVLAGATAEMGARFALAYAVGVSLLRPRTAARFWLLVQKYGRDFCRSLAVFVCDSAGCYTRLVWDMETVRREVLRCRSHRLEGSTGAAARLGVADHALDRWKARAQRPFHIIDPFVHVGHGEQGIDLAMKVDDLA